MALAAARNTQGRLAIMDAQLLVEMPAMYAEGLTTDMQGLEDLIRRQGKQGKHLSLGRRQGRQPRIDRHRLAHDP